MIWPDFHVNQITDSTLYWKK